MRPPKADGSIHAFRQDPMRQWFDDVVPRRYEIIFDGCRYWKPASIRKLIKWLEWCLKKIEDKKN